MKHTYEDLVRAGAPELPIGYYYRVDKYEQYSVTIDERNRLDHSRPYGFAFIQGGLSTESVINACEEAHKDLLHRIEMKRREDEWLGTY